MIFGYPIFRQIKFIHFHAVPKLTDRTRLTVTGHPLWSSCKHSRVDLENGMEIFHQKKSAPLAQGTADGAQLKKILRSSMSLDTIFCSILDVAAFLCFAPTSLTKTVWIEIMSLMFQANSLGDCYRTSKLNQQGTSKRTLCFRQVAPRNPQISMDLLDLTDLHGHIGTPNHKWCFGWRVGKVTARQSRHDGSWQTTMVTRWDFGWLGMSPDGVSEVRPWNYTYIYMYIVRACYVISIYLSISLCIYIYTCIFPHISGDLEYPMLKRGDTAEGSMPSQLSSIGNFAKLGWFQSFRFPTYSCLIIVSVRPRFTHTHKMSWPKDSEHDPIDVGSLHPWCRPHRWGFTWTAQGRSLALSVPPRCRGTRGTEFLVVWINIRNELPKSPQIPGFIIIFLIQMALNLLNLA